MSEGELTAWVSIYEGRPVGHENPVSGLVEGVKSGDCLVVLGDTDEEGPVVWSYEPQSESGFWSLAEEGAGGPLYEFGRNSQAATRAEIVRRGRLRLVRRESGGVTPEALFACTELWNRRSNSPIRQRLLELEPEKVSVTLAGADRGRCIITAASIRHDLAEQFGEEERTGGTTYWPLVSGPTDTLPSGLKQWNASVAEAGMVYLDGGPRD